MQIIRSSTDVATGKGPAEWFTGDVYIDPVAAPAGPSRVLAEPGVFHHRAGDGPGNPAPDPAA